MSDGLWRDDLRCGCQKGSGHVCRPSWVLPEEWVRSGVESGPGESLGQGFVSPGPNPLMKQEAPMEFTHPRPSGNTNLGDA